MPPRAKKDELTTQGHVRLFRQKKGPRPDSRPLYAGLQDQYLNLTGVSIPVRGGSEPIHVPDPNNLKSFIQVGRSDSAPGFASVTLEVLERHDSIPFALSNLRCFMNIYEVRGQCKDLSDFLNGYKTIVIYENCEPQEVDAGDRTSWTDDEQLMDSISLQADAIYAIGAVSFGQKGGSQIDREVVDVVYGHSTQCDDCGEETDRIYAVTKSSGSGSPGLPAELIYTLDGGSTINQTTITSFGATEDPLAIDIVGQYLVIIGSAAYYYAELNEYTGIPGAFTKVTSGFVTDKNPQDLYVAGPNEVYFCGSGGYIYKATDIKSGVDVIDAGDTTTADLKRIDGIGDTIVSVGASSTVIFSRNRGATWSTTTDNPSDIALTIQALEVKSDLEWWTGTLNSGRMFYTLNGGESWTEKTFAGHGAGNVRDIVFATDTIGWMAYDNNDPSASVFETHDGGFSWSTSTARVKNVPVFDRANRLAHPTGHPTIKSNYLAVAGLAGNGTDGVLLVGAANII